MNTEKADAVIRLLQRQDEDDAKRVHHLRLDGKPDRFARWAELPMRYIVHKLTEQREHSA